MFSLTAKRFGVLVAVVVAALGAVTTPAGAQSPPTPQNDAFYQPPAGYETSAPGTVLRSRPVSLAAFSLLPQKVQAWQLLYRTTDLHGDPTSTVTTVILPSGAKASTARPLLSYQVAEDSPSAQCAPSYALQQGSSFESVVVQAEILLIDAAVRQGWAVSVPDHEGPGSHLGSAREPGYAALDGIRAAEGFSPLGLAGANTPVGLWGYSGGGLASSWTAQEQPTYAPELNIKGAALGAPVPNLGALVQRINGGPFSGLIASGIAALSKAYPAIADLFTQYANPAGKAMLAKALTQCNAANAAGFTFTDYNKYLRIPLTQALAQPAVQAVFDDVSLGGQAPTAPTYVYQGVNDEIVNVADVDRQVANYCAAGDSVTYKRDLVSEHVSLVITGAADALNWLKDRLGGGPAPQGCTSDTVVSTLLNPGALSTLGSVLSGDLLALLGAPIGPVA